MNLRKHYTRARVASVHLRRANAKKRECNDGVTEFHPAIIKAHVNIIIAP
jgi:hypothetical protein